MSRKLREPRQQRSQLTLERILIAAEELLREAGATDVSVREICARADASPSSFYARFPERSTLHQLLFDRFTRRTLDLLDSFRDTGPVERHSFEAFATDFIDRFTLRWSEESGLIHALASEERDDAELRGKRQWLEREILRRALALASDVQEDFDRPSTEAKIYDALPAISATFRGAAASPDQLGFEAPDARERLVRDLSRLILGFVVFRETGAPNR